jgi:hypothetical protein
VVTSCDRLTMQQGSEKRLCDRRRKQYVAPKRYAAKRVHGTTNITMETAVLHARHCFGCKKRHKTRECVAPVYTARCRCRHSYRQGLHACIERWGLKWRWQARRKELAHRATAKPASWPWTGSRRGGACWKGTVGMKPAVAGSVCG